MAKPSLEGTLDLGIAKVALYFEDDLGNDMGRAHSQKREIKLRRDLSGPALSSTLLHEVLHIWDDLALNNGLQGNGDPHQFLDVLANLMDEFLRRNWQVLEVLYAKRGGRRSASRTRSKPRRQPPTQRRKP